MTGREASSDQSPIVVVDMHTHWYPRPLLDAYVKSDGYPSCRREGDSFAIERLPGSWTSLPLHFVEIDLQLDIMRTEGVDIAVSSSASFGDVDALPVSQAVAVAVAVNEARAAVAERDRGFLGIATIPWQDATAAREVLADAISRLGLVGVALHSNIAGRPVDDPSLRPIYEQLSALGVPLLLHPGRTLLKPFSPDLGLETAVSYMFDSSIAAYRLAFSGILDDLTLDVVHPHCGATLPYLAGRIDSVRSLFASSDSAAGKRAGTALRDFYTDTVCQSSETLAFAHRFYGTEHMLFGSDCPYFSQQTSVDLVRSSLPEETHRAVLCDNALQLLSISSPPPGSPGSPGS